MTEYLNIQAQTLDEVRVYLIEHYAFGPHQVDLSTRHLKSIAKFCHFSAVFLFFFFPEKKKPKPL